jgi:hypothetical protein
VDTSTRLRIATRIHFALLRHYGAKVEIGALMKAEGDVREAIWVCEASGDAELAAMARQLRLANDEEAAPVAPVATAPVATAPVAATPQEAPWAGNTSGFGVSRPIALDAAKAESSANWLKPTTWVRRAAPARNS